MSSARLRSFVAIALTVAFLVAWSSSHLPVWASYHDYSLERGYGSNLGHHGSYRLREQRHGYVTFGIDGRDGRSGREGRAARDQATKVVDLFGSLPTDTFYDFSGTEGSAGENGAPGEFARSCRVPYRPAYSLVGADGGNGGNGGDGGDGSNGSDVSIYYDDVAALKQVAIANAGGLGGIAGLGAAGADGCECVEPAWVVKFCEWEVWRRRDSVESQEGRGEGQEGTEWEYATRKIEPCTGVRRVDMREYAPHIETRDYVHSGYSRYANEYRYDLRYGGVVQTRRFGCEDGDRGQTGADGRNGADGRYGSFRLIPRAEIPQERIEYSATLSAQLNQTVELVKNIWEQRTGLRALLNPASNTPDSYSYLKSTERPKYRLEWAANESPEDLGVADVSTRVLAESVGDRATLTLDIPGTLDYTLSERSGIQVASITGGFSPNRVKSFELENVFAKVGESKLTLVDKGDLRNLLPQTKIEIWLLTKQSASGLTTDSYQPRHNATFYIRKGTAPIEIGNLNIVDNLYTFDLGKRFRAWLQPGYDAMYKVEIQQTTNSGALYTQTEEIPFQVEPEHQ